MLTMTISQVCNSGGQTANLQPKPSNVTPASTSTTDELKSAVIEVCICVFEYVVTCDLCWAYCITWLCKQVLLNSGVCFTQLLQSHRGGLIDTELVKELVTCYPHLALPAHLLALVDDWTDVLEIVWYAFGVAWCVLTYYCVACVTWCWR